MKVQIKLFATLRDYLPEGSDKRSCQMEFDTEPRVIDIFGQLNLPEDIPKIILINGIQSDQDQRLKDGDTLSVFPPVAGGAC
jgi:sulfur carrier protein